LTQLLDVPILVDDDDQERPVDMAYYASHALSRRDWHEVTGNKLSVIQQGGECNKENSIQGGRQKHTKDAPSCSKNAAPSWKENTLASVDGTVGTTSTIEFRK
jgi:hypothetical protein